MFVLFIISFLDLDKKNNFCNQANANDEKDEENKEVFA